MSKVVDGFLFYNELDLLELRLQELNDVVDKFVLVESNKTFSGRAKPYYFTENLSRFKRWYDKIEVFQLDDHGQFDDRLHPSWEREYYARNTIADGFWGDDPEDILIISDVDEIPNPLSVANYKFKTMIANSMNVYTYRLNIWSGGWHGSKAVRRHSLTSPQEIRMTSPKEVTEEFGWHFTSLGDADTISDKFKSFAHTEIAVPAYTDPAMIQYRIDNLIDPIDREIFERVEIDETWPKTILENMEYWKKWVV